MDLHIKAVWPRRRIPSQESLQVVRENPDALDGVGRGQAPQSFEIRLVRDAGARFAGAKPFIDELKASVLRFYAEAGQPLKKWQPAAPKMAPEDPPPTPREGEQTAESTRSS